MHRIHRVRPRQLGGVALTLIFLVAACATATAGFIPSSINLGFTPGEGPPPWAGEQGPPPFVFELAPNNPQFATMDIEEDFLGLDPLAISVSGVTNDDPILEITKNVTNNTGATWFGYEIGLNGGSNSFVAGSASSDKFSLLSETSNLLTFGLPSPVADGETVSFTFQVNIPSTGPFDFSIRQSAVVPEPTSVALILVGAGTGLLLVCRKQLA